MYFHFIVSIFVAIALTLMAISDNLVTRMLYLVAVLVLYYMTFIVFSWDYDKKMMERWKTKENKLKNELISDFVQEKISKKYS